MAKRKKTSLSSSLLTGNEPPTKEETTNLIQAIEPKETDRMLKFSLADAKEEKEQQPAYKTNNGRIRYTTVLNENIKKNLQQIAKNKGVSVADIIEVSLVAYFGEAIKD